LSFPLITRRSFITEQECLQIRRAMDSGGVEAAEVLTDGIQRQLLVRNAVLIEPEAAVIAHVEARLESCRADVATALGLTLGRREGPGFIRYADGGFYRRHRDRGDDPGWEGAARRAVALVLFMNTSRDRHPDGEFDGGLLRIFDGDRVADVVPEMGTLVAFPAGLMHEVTDVRGGTRDTVVDWFYVIEPE
jgi:predicted 2-oxoglutarate/Fe(II)-dependent dioxygenase YbiX